MNKTLMAIISDDVVPLARYVAGSLTTKLNQRIKSSARGDLWLVRAEEQRTFERLVQLVPSLEPSGAFDASTFAADELCWGWDEKE